LAHWSKSGNIRSPEDFARPEVKRVAIANPVHVAYGRLAKRALERAGVWPAVEPKLILAETVWQTVQFSGNVDAACFAGSSICSALSSGASFAVRGLAVR
jgi:molybdate transport system substrate-binding protein